MRFPSVFPAADSKVNWMLSYKLMAKKLVRWGKGKRAITPDYFFNLFYFTSVKEEGKWGAGGTRGN